MIANYKSTAFSFKQIEKGINYFHKKYRKNLHQTTKNSRNKLIIFYQNMKTHQEGS